FIVRHEYPAYDCRAELARITCPAWVAVGRHDWICPVDQAEEIHKLIPHSTLTVFERSGHSPQMEERDSFTRELAAFFAPRSPGHRSPARASPSLGSPRPVPRAARRSGLARLAELIPP